MGDWKLSDQKAFFIIISNNVSTVLFASDSGYEETTLYLRLYIYNIGLLSVLSAPIQAARYTHTPEDPQAVAWLWKAH